MHSPVKLQGITIRTALQPGDIGYITYLHGKLYKEEYKYEIEFEAYVAGGLVEFYRNYNPAKDRVWICEHDNKIIGCLLLMNRGEAAQLRYFLLEPTYRGMGLGKKLMELFMDFLHVCNYKSSYLWTTNELYEAAALYKKYGFVLTAEKESTAFSKSLREQRYDLTVK